MRRRFEVASQGIDEALAGVSVDPFGGSLPAASGLRIPAFVNGADNRYLFLLATQQLRENQFTRIRGWRQLLTIGLNVAPTGIPSYPCELQVTSPQFRFSDGANVSWHLVLERPQLTTQAPRPTDAPSFAFQTSSTAALLYSTASWDPGFFDPITGSPFFYQLGMNSYTPPIGYRAQWQPIGDLGNCHEIRAPWVSDRAWNSLDIDVEGPGRVCLYATVQQSDANARPQPTYPSTTVLPPEWAFVQAQTTNPEEGVFAGPVFWRVGGALIFEDLDRESTCGDIVRVTP